MLKVLKLRKNVQNWEIYELMIGDGFIKVKFEGINYLIRSIYMVYNQSRMSLETFYTDNPINNYVSSEVDRHGGGLPTSSWADDRPIITLPQHQPTTPAPAEPAPAPTTPATPPAQPPAETPATK
jgi:hypothetical protein